MMEEEIQKKLLEAREASKIKEPKKTTKKTPEKPTEKKEIYTPEPPKATVPKTTIPATTAPKIDTVSGTDVTANMDNEQKEIFKDMKKKAQAVPQLVDTRRPFCQRMAEIKKRRALRRARG